MKNIIRYTILFISAAFLHCAYAHAQTFTTCVGLVLKTDSTDNIFLPKIVEILPATAADAEPDIKVGMYVLRVGDLYCRNMPMSKIMEAINGDEEGTPVGMVISADKEVFPKYVHVLKRGPAPQAPPPHR